MVIKTLITLLTIILLTGCSVATFNKDANTSDGFYNKDINVKYKRAVIKLINENNEMKKRIALLEKNNLNQVNDVNQHIISDEIINYSKTK